MSKIRKKSIIFGLLIFCIFILGYFFLYEKTNTRDNIDITFDQSDNFSKAELNAATDKIINYFNVHLDGAKLHTITFDNDMYKQEIASIDDNEVSKDNLLIFATNFNTGKHPDSSMEKNQEISHWKIFLSRKNKKDAWDVIDQGV